MGLNEYSRCFGLCFLAIFRVIGKHFKTKTKKTINSRINYLPKKPNGRSGYRVLNRSDCGFSHISCFFYVKLKGKQEVSFTTLICDFFLKKIKIIKQKEIEFVVLIYSISVPGLHRTSDSLAKRIVQSTWSMTISSICNFFKADMSFAWLMWQCRKHL